MFNYFSLLHPVLIFIIILFFIQGLGILIFIPIVTEKINEILRLQGKEVNNIIKDINTLEILKSISMVNNNILNDNSSQNIFNRFANIDNINLNPIPLNNSGVVSDTPSKVNSSNNSIIPVRINTPDLPITPNTPNTPITPITPITPNTPNTQDVDTNIITPKKIFPYNLNDYLNTPNLYIQLTIDYLRNIFSNGMEKEKSLIEKNKLEYILVFVFTTFGLLLFLGIYSYFYRNKINFNWKYTFIGFGCILLLIMCYLIIYIFAIVNNKKFNELKAELFAFALLQSI